MSDGHETRRVGICAVFKTKSHRVRERSANDDLAAGEIVLKGNYR